jgi:hypothetical protein
MTKSISFKYKFVNEDNGTEFYSSIWINNYDRKLLKNPKKIVIKDKKIAIEFSYPLENVFVFNFKSKNGFTRRQLVEHIINTYKQIYEEEEKTNMDTGKVVTNCRLLNRPTTSGKYGIWGHAISDLVIEKILYEPKKKLVTLHIGS